MPLVPFNSLPSDARVWVFGAASPIEGEQADKLLRTVDEYLAQWKAHGEPLTVGRDWREDRFLTIAVDQSDAHASGCSIDGLFRVLKELEPELGTSIVGSSRMFYRDSSGSVCSVERSNLTPGTLSPKTIVFDQTVSTLVEWRARFEVPALQSWHSAYVSP